MPRSLFRKEAIDAQREKFLGEASVAQPVRLWVYTTTACAIAALVVTVAIWGQYTRRERVQGVLSNAIGAAAVHTPDAGTLSELLVHEGDVVAKGAPLARLTVDRSGTNDAQGSQALIDTLKQRKSALAAQREQTEALGQQESRQARQHVADLRNQIEALDIELRMQVERAESQRVTADEWKNLGENERFISDIRIRQEQDKVREEEIKAQDLRRARTQLAVQLSDAQAAVGASELRNRAELERIGVQSSEADQAMAQQALDRELSVTREMVIAAPIAGTVTNITPSAGQTVAADAPLATILPTDAALHAELLVPSRAIGFVQPGQNVNLRYEAFPYERFGQYHGTVESVGRTILMQGDAIGSLPVREPAYRIVVRLDRQTVDAGAEQLPLRAGMVVGADLLMEKRSLIEWLFQPVLQLRHRMAGAAAT